jgi:hypothetical protein
VLVLVLLLLLVLVMRGWLCCVVLGSKAHMGKT